MAAYICKLYDIFPGISNSDGYTKDDKASVDEVEATMDY